MIGIDIEEVDRFDLPKNHAFLKKVFTKSEIDYAFSKTKPAIHLCGMFCAKEATIKALPIKIQPKDILIMRNKQGKPSIKLRKHLRGHTLALSISHSTNYAVAVVLDHEL